MTRLAIILAMTAISMSFIISFAANAERVGVEVSERFLERSSKMPSGRNEDDTPAKNLKRWVEDPSTESYARAYAWTVMPLDFIYLLALGGFLASASASLASLIAVPERFSHFPLLLCLLLPLAYVVADLAEDILIVRLLTVPQAIGDGAVQLLGILRSTKIAANALATAQVFVLAALSFLWSS